MMSSLHSPTHGSGRFRAARHLAAALAVLMAACVSSETSSGLSDKNAPTISLSAGTLTDSLMTFNVSATDNLGLLHVDAVAGAPGISTVCDTTFNTAVTSFTRLCSIVVPATVPVGTTVTVLAQSVDGNHNLSPVDTLLLVTGGGTPAQVVLTFPRVNPRDTVPVGFTSAVSISGRARAGVHVLGWQIDNAFATGPFRDSVVYATPMKDTIALDTSQSYAGATPGLATMTPFMYDSLGRLYVGPPVQFQIVATAGNNTIPVVNFGITKRVEVTDTVHVTATDRAGVAYMGYVVRQMPPNDAIIIARDSIAVAANTSTAVHTFTMALPIVTFPTTVLVEAFATNATGRQDSARIPVGNTGFIRHDTITVVAGLTRPLPNGGAVADGIYHTPTNRIYLTNIEKNQLEVFNLGDSSFKTPIPVGSRPWGIAARPADHTGAMTDTLIVANSGGTLLSFVDVNLATAHEVYRYALPNLIFFTVTSVALSNGVLVEHRKQHDFSDRPQYVAATCTGAGVACADLEVAYTTTPTQGQTLPFTNQGTIRWENITQRSSHFFFEQAVGQSDAANIDTIVVERYQAQGYGSDSTLVPFIQGPFITGPDTSYFSVTTNTPLIGFRDTTFTRNSGNFTRAVFGEGGRVGTTSGQPNARAMTLDATQGMVPSFTSKGHTYTTADGFLPVFDDGVSRPVDVSDFIANTSTSVSSVAINFDGATSSVRADSTALFDITLRLQGLLQTSQGNSGVDFHPGNFGVPARPAARSSCSRRRRRPRSKCGTPTPTSSACRCRRATR
jgi:hypothetical protein